MPKDAKGKEQPGGVVGRAVKAAKITAGEIKQDSDKNEGGKSKAAAKLGRKDGQARVKAIPATRARRRALAQKAAAVLAL